MTRRHLTRRSPSTAGRRWSRRSRPAARSSRRVATSPTSPPTIPPSGRGFASSRQPAPARRRGPSRRAAPRAHPTLVAERSPAGVRRRPSQGDEIHVVAPDGTARSTVAAGDGWHVDDLQWIDEGCLALIAAPQITDTAVGLGSLRGSAGAGPLVCTNDRLRRRLVTMDLSTGRPEPIDTGPATVWEMCPLGRERFVAIVSDDPTESGWYAARLSMLDRVGGEQPLHQSAWQIAAPRVSPDGSRVALVEGWSSDRGFVAGGVVVIDLLERSATAWSIDDLDVTGLEWLDDRTLHVHGWRGTRSARGTVGRDGDHASIVVDEDVLREHDDRAAAAGPVTTAAVMERAGAPARIVVGSGEGGWRTVGAPAARRGPRAERRRALVDGGGRHRAARAAAHPGRRRSGPRRAGAAPPRRTGEPVDARRISRRRRARLVGLRRDPAQPARQRRTRAGVRPGQPRRSRRPGARRRPRRGGDVPSRGPRRSTAPPAVVGGSYGGYLTAAAAVLRRDVAAAVVMYGHPDLVSARYGSNNPAFYDILLGGPPTDETFALYRRSLAGVPRPPRRAADADPAR